MPFDWGTAKAPSLDDFEGPRYKRIAKLQSLIDAGRVDEQLRWLAAEVPVAAG